MADEGKVNVKLVAGTRITGEDYEAGDSVEVYPAERDHLVAYGYAEGSEAEEEKFSDFGGGSTSNKRDK